MSTILAIYMLPLRTKRQMDRHIYIRHDNNDIYGNKFFFYYEYLNRMMMAWYMEDEINKQTNAVRRLPKHTHRHHTHTHADTLFSSTARS